MRLSTITAISLLARPVRSFNANPKMSSAAINRFFTSTTSRAAVTGIDDVLLDPSWPPTWPYKPADFARQDESDDSGFYSTPRLVEHIDKPAIKALTSFYATEFSKLGPDAKLLDICSSWISHYPSQKTWASAKGNGMVEQELQENKQLDSFTISDLNKKPILPYPDDEFDAVTCAVSFDYLTKPVEVMQEMSRVLKPGGKVILSQSNRCFPTKAIAIWLQTNDVEHAFILGSFFHYSEKFEPAVAIDISPDPGRSDPLFVVMGEVKKGIADEHASSL
jgi:SAM-dependent methyltransferase